MAIQGLLKHAKMTTLDNLFNDENSDVLRELEEKNIGILKRMGERNLLSNDSRKPFFGDNIKTAKFKNPLNNRDWNTYNVQDFGEKFFNEVPPLTIDGRLTVRFGGPPETTSEPDPEATVGMTKVEQFYRKTVTEFFTYTDTNRNKVYDKNKDIYTGKLFNITLFLSTDGAWLLEEYKKLAYVKDDELVVFIEVFDLANDDVISDTVMLVKGGNIPAAYFNNQYILNWFHKQLSVSDDTVTALLKSSGNGSSFSDAIRGLLSGFGLIAGKLTGSIGDGICWIAEQIEKLNIEKNTWDKNRIEKLLEFLDEQEKNIYASLDKIIQQKGFEIGDAIIPLPDSIIGLVQQVRNNMTVVFAGIQGAIKSAGKYIEFYFALICGIINGALDMVGGIIMLIGWILKAIGGAIKGGAEVAANTDYYYLLLLEYADNFLQVIKRIDWIEVIKNVAEGFKKIYDQIDVAKLLSEININGRDMGYYTGYIGINILACFIGVGEVAAITRIGKLEGPMRQIVETVVAVVGKLPTGAKLTVETVFTILKGYIQLLAKGTKAVLDVINSIFEALLKWMGKMIGIKTKSIDNLAGIGEQAIFRRIAYSNGIRGETLLTSIQKKEIVEYAKLYDINEQSIHFMDELSTKNTSYSEFFGEEQLVINTDVMPGVFTTANSRLSWRAAIAHELEGHRAAALNQKTFFDPELEKFPNDLLEEIPASLRAHKYGIKLSDEEKRDLFDDALERFHRHRHYLSDTKYKNYSFTQLQELLWISKN